MESAKRDVRGDPVLQNGQDDGTRDPPLLSATLNTPPLPSTAPQEAWREAHGLVRNLLSRLPYPDRLPAPEVLVEADGDLGFDWTDSGATVSASLRDDGMVRWAALIGDYRAHGHFQLPTWSEPFNRAMTLFGEHIDAAPPLARPPQEEK